MFGKLSKKHKELEHQSALMSGQVDGYKQQIRDQAEEISSLKLELAEIKNKLCKYSKPKNDDKGYNLLYHDLKEEYWLLYKQGIGIYSVSLSLDWKSANDVLLFCNHKSKMADKQVFKNIKQVIFDMSKLLDKDSRFIQAIRYDYERHDLEIDVLHIG